MCVCVHVRVCVCVYMCVCVCVCHDLLCSTMICCLRFPCCGKPYPCDTCHDEAEDHVMERANRMICGFCSREQTYSGSRPCVGCGMEVVGGRAGAYWEGGKGCRNKIKMSR